MLILLLSKHNPELDISWNALGFFLSPERIRRIKHKNTVDNMKHMYDTSTTSEFHQLSFLNKYYK